MTGLRERKGSARRRGRRWRRILGGVVLVLLSGILALEVAIRRAEIPAGLLGAGGETSLLLDRHGRIIAELPGRRVRSCRPVPLGEISPWLVSATLAAEDHRFRSHHGVDPVGTLRALFQNLRSGRVVSGASTITQQLVKLHFPASERGWRAKLHENLAALRLERELGKERILELYLNRIDYGNGLRGAEAAARGYFGRAAAELSLPEAVFLAGLPQAPSAYNPRRHPAQAAARFQRLSARLAVLGWLSHDQQASLQFPPSPRMDIGIPAEAPHFTAALEYRGGVPSGTVRTTLDLDLQRQVEGILRRHLARLASSDVGHAAALILDHRDGSVRVWCGSGNWSGPGGQIDGVTLPRSPGSTLKPFLYLRAVDRKVLTAATVLPDTPDAIRTEYADYDPRNYDDRFWGPVRVREALANSLNVPAVVALARTGARDVTEYLRRCGIPLNRSLDASGAGMILGNSEVRMLDLAAAYGAFGEGGMSAMPRMLETDPLVNRAIASPAATAIITDILADNDARRKTFGPFSPLAFEGLRIPCKTGTSSGFRDAWTIGVTGRHVVAVWMGNFSGMPMHEVASVTGPAPAWRDIADLLTDEDGGVESPGRELGLEHIPISPLTGLLPVDAGPEPVMEYFLHGTAPVEDSRVFFSGKGPAARLLLPPEYAVWCSSSHNYLDAGLRGGGELAIVQPRKDAKLLLDPQIPADRQMLELIATGGDGSELVWEVDGMALLPVAGEGKFLWPLRRGVHRVMVSQGQRRAEVSFDIE